MRVTVSVIKADIGSVGGHTLPSGEVLECVRERVTGAVGTRLLDAHVGHTGDDICLVMTHTHGVTDARVHGLAWDAFNAGSAPGRPKSSSTNVPTRRSWCCAPTRLSQGPSTSPCT